MDWAAVLPWVVPVVTLVLILASARRPHPNHLHIAGLLEKLSQTRPPEPHEAPGGNAAPAAKQPAKQPPAAL
jgi:hypothetical protein